jgi:BirA family transcriptional regulator, biotin operon repressor / biotin---[acetyl-CoA-carboxylase] ligase
MASVYNDLDRPPLNEHNLQRALMVPPTEHGDVEGAIEHGELSARGFAALRVLPRVDSTNAILAEAAADGAPHGSVVIAEEQTAGRGRLGRTWTAPTRSGLFLSILARPTAPQAAWGWLPLLAGVAACSALTRTGGAEVKLKWPNDLIVPTATATEYGTGRKLGGILCERVLGGAAVVIGIGINVTLRADELPAPHATSLALAGANTTDRDPLLRALLREFGSWYERWAEAGGDAERSGLADAYRAECATLGAKVRADLPGGGAISGTAVGIDESGRLVIEDGDGARRPIAAGDVVHLR